MTRHRIRGLLGVKSNDGHDAPLLVVSSMLQAAGIEVVYAGYDLTADQMVRATIQEGVHFTGISSYNGGHLPFFRKVQEGLREKSWPFIHVVGGGGATITEGDAAILEKEGVDHLFRSGEGMAAVDFIIKNYDFAAVPGAPRDLLASALGGDALALGLLINHLEERQRLEGMVVTLRNSRPLAEWAQGAPADLLAMPLEGSPWTAGEALDRMRELDGSFHISEIKDRGPGRVVGFTGRGGSGKSTLIDQLVRLWFADKGNDGRRLALVAVDPSSPETGGAVLADRMSYVYATDRRWVDVGRLMLRSMASRGEGGGICRALPSTLALLRAAGFDVMVETYGTGQPDTALHSHVDQSIFVTTPDFGGAAQLQKEAMLAMPGVRVVLNKQDLDTAPRALELLKARLGHHPLYTTCAVEHRDPGVESLYRDLWGAHATG